MSAQFDVVLSDDLNRDIDKEVEANATTRDALIYSATDAPDRATT